MDSVFETYVTAGEADSGHGIYLDLPAAPKALQKAVDRLQLQTGEKPLAAVTLCTFNPLLVRLLRGRHDLYELDTLARQIAQMDSHTADMFHALLCMEENRTNGKTSVSRLLTLAGYTGSCRVLPGVQDDAALGRLRRTAENGVFVAGIGYVTCPQEIPQTAQAAVPGQPVSNYTVLLEMQDGTQCRLPAAGPLLAGSFRCLDCVVADMADAISASTDIISVQQLAEALAALPPETLRICRAAAAAMGCPDMQQALFIAQHPTQFYVYPDIRTPEDVVRSELAVFVNRDIAEKMLPYLDMQRFGESILKEHNAALTAYGLVERVQYEPLCSERVVLSDNKCLASAYGPMTQQM